MAIAALDAKIRKQSTIGWLLFRALAGSLVALGLFCWVGLWFQRNFWLGVAQAIMCGLVLAKELGVLKDAPPAEPAKPRTDAGLT